MSVTGANSTCLRPPGTRPGGRKGRSVRRCESLESTERWVDRSCPRGWPVPRRPTIEQLFVRIDTACIARHDPLERLVVDDAVTLTSKETRGRRTPGRRIAAE